MKPPQQAITAFGDSHGTYFFETAFYAGRLGLQQPLSYRINGRIFAGASVAGFRGERSTLMVREAILATLPGCDRLILAFGQVDLELGYYYRLAVKGEAIDPGSYVTWLTGIYVRFLAGFLPAGHCRVAVKGVNLTALAPRPFATRYVARVVKEGTTLTQAEAERRVEPFILAEDAQNAMHLQFNAELARQAAALGCGYFDLVAQTGNGSLHGLSTQPLRLADHFRTAGFDHHLADTVVTRRLHYEAAGRAFGLI